MENTDSETRQKGSDSDSTNHEVYGRSSMDPGVGIPPAANNGAANLLHPDQQQDVIPDIVIRRLPVYVRTLRGLREQGIASISSDELASRIGVSAAQIRRDLSYFGKFGKQGRGYDTGFLAGAIGQILGLERRWDVALAGLGNLGRAIVNYRGFRASSFDIVALFDSNPRHIGQEIEGMPVLSASEITTVVQERGIQVGIVAVRAAGAQQVADQMVSGGIRAILNYAPVVLKVPGNVTVREIDPVSALQSMTYYLGATRKP
jgi:redox-sensing transcriptional repressor